MSGIGGIVARQSVPAAWARGMNAVQAHRGPDGSGQWSSPDGRVQLAHRRLAILDRSERGAQPMADAGGRYRITFNGEIDNDLEPRAELRQLGHVFHSDTDTDTEVILEAYKAWGEACLDRFNGMFAFALYDTVDQRLPVRRDSSAIVSLVRKVIHPDGAYHTFTGRFPGTSADEWRYAEPVIADTGVVSHGVEPTSAGFAAELGEFLWYNEPPVGSSSQYAQYCVFRLAREHGITVLLDGQGSDELLGGYEQYFRFYVAALEKAGDRNRLAEELPRIRERYPLALTPPARAWRDRLPFAARRWLSHRLGIGTLAVRVEAGHRPAGGGGEPARPGRALSCLERRAVSGFLRHVPDHPAALRRPQFDGAFPRGAVAVLRSPAGGTGAVAAPSAPDGRSADQTPVARVAARSVARGRRARWNKQGFRPLRETWFQGPLLAMAEDLLHSRSFCESAYRDAPWWHRALARLKRGETHLGWTLWAPFIGEAWKRELVGRCAGRRPPALAKPEMTDRRWAVGETHDNRVE